MKPRSPCRVSGSSESNSWSRLTSAYVFVLGITPPEGIDGRRLRARVEHDVLVRDPRQRVLIDPRDRPLVHRRGVGLSEIVTSAWPRSGSARSTGPSRRWPDRSSPGCRSRARSFSKIRAQRVRGAAAEQHHDDQHDRDRDQRSERRRPARSRHRSLHQVFSGALAGAIVESYVVSTCASPRALNLAGPDSLLPYPVPPRCRRGAIILSESGASTATGNRRGPR